MQSAMTTQEITKSNNDHITRTAFFADGSKVVLKAFNPVDADKEARSLLDAELLFIYSGDPNDYIWYADEWVYKNELSFENCKYNTYVRDRKIQ